MVDEATESKRSKSTARRFSSWLGRLNVSFILILIVIIAATANVVFRQDSAEVLLTVTSDSSLTVKGVVLYDGGPVEGGYVHLQIDDARTQRYLVSAVVGIEQGGTFEAGESKLAIEADTLKSPLAITARFLGRVVRGKEGREQHKAVSGESTVYLRFSPPLLGRPALWTTAGVAGALMAGLIFLFTGDLTPQRARVLFFATYLMTFVAVGAPIALTLVLSQNDYLVSLMQGAPLGIVRGKAKAISEPQWLLNVGGAVRETGPPQAAASPAASTTGTSDTDEKKSPTVTVAVSSRTPRAAGRASTPDIAVEGGLAVPFYVVFLAMLGAGINMTIQVPRIQQTYYTTAGSERQRTFWWRFLFRNRSQPVPVSTMMSVRRELIQNYMYLLSAPFIAIAVYYLLQVVGANTSEPVLVTAAFATGFTSDRIVALIIDFAERRLTTEEQRKRREEETKKVEETNKAQLENQTTKAQADKARAEAEREQAVAARLKAETEAKQVAAPPNVPPQAQQRPGGQAKDAEVPEKGSPKP